MSLTSEIRAGGSISNDGYIITNNHEIGDADTRSSHCMLGGTMDDTFQQAGRERLPTGRATAIHGIVMWSAARFTMHYRR